MPRERNIFNYFVHIYNKFIQCLFIAYTQVLVWQHQWCAIQSLCRGDVGVLSRGCSEAEEDPGDVRGPCGDGAAGAQGVLEAAVEPLYHPIGLGVVGSGLLVLDLQKRTH
jgi:hypothetical protein